MSPFVQLHPKNVSNYCNQFYTQKQLTVQTKQNFYAQIFEEDDGSRILQELDLMRSQNTNFFV
jgi:hypothetical protein